MVGSLIGTRVVRVEDPDLLTGKGTFIANLRVPGMVHGFFVRSTMAHALIRSVDADAARRSPGVVAVFTAADLGVAPFHGFMVLNEHCARPPLATDKVRFVGEAVAVGGGRDRRRRSRRRRAGRGRLRPASGGGRPGRGLGRRTPRCSSRRWVPTWRRARRTPTTPDPLAGAAHDRAGPLGEPAGGGGAHGGQRHRRRSPATTATATI